MPKVMIITPPSGIYCREDRCQSKSEDIHTLVRRPPLNMMYLVSLAKKAKADYIARDYSDKYDVWAEMEKDVSNYQPDYVFLDVTTPSLKMDLKSAALIKKVSPKSVAIGRGAHFTIYDKQALLDYPDLDIVLRNEYEFAAREIMSGVSWEKILGITYRKEGQIIRNESRPPMDLDEIPFPDKDWLDVTKFIRPDTGQPQTIIRIGEGCPYECVYCLAGVVNGNKIRLRSPQNVIDEIKENVSKYGITDFLFRSDGFTYNNKWVLDFCNKIKQEGLNITWACNARVKSCNLATLKTMKEAGCWAIGIGIESGSQDSLDKMKKGFVLDEAVEFIKLVKLSKIKAFTYFVIGFPWETHKHILDTINFAVKVDGDLAQFSPIYPYPGTELYKMVLEAGLIKEGEFSPNALAEPVIGTQYLSVDELKRYFKLANRTFYLRLGYIIRTLLHSGGFKNSLNYCKHGVKLLKEAVKFSPSRKR